MEITNIGERKWERGRLDGIKRKLQVSFPKKSSVEEEGALEETHCGTIVEHFGIAKALEKGQKRFCCTRDDVKVKN